jgi:hypothetical protein
MKYKCKENDAVIELGKDKEEVLISINEEKVKTVIGIKDLKQALILFGVSCSSTPKEAIMHYDHLIKKDLATTFKELRDHGTHADFCDKINEVRTKAILNYS